MRSILVEGRLAIVADWFAFEMSIPEVARKHRCSANTVKRAWRWAVRSDLVPNIRRPSQRTIAAWCESSIIHNADALLASSWSDPDPNEGRPIVIPARDPLLTALKREHGNDPRRQADTLRICRLTDRPVLPTRQHNIVESVRPL